MAESLELVVDGLPLATMVADPGRTLLRVLRDDLGRTGTKEGCDDSECGACMVLIDGRPVNSCSYLALQAAGRATEAKVALVRARERTTDARRGARLDLRLAAVLRMLGERAEAVGAVQRAIIALERDRGPLVAEAKAQEADLAWAENDLPETARLARAALEAARRSGATTVEVDALKLLGAASVRLGRDDGLDLLEDAVRLYPRDAKLHVLQAKTYAALGKRLLQHQSQAEYYVLQGSLRIFLFPLAEA